jgi:ubiquitin carboxyl-terminal hydrolase 36/42
MFCCQVKCIQCLYESNQYEPMMDIQGNVKSLEDALAQFTDTELLDGANKYSVTSMCFSCALEISVVAFMSISKARKLDSLMLLETSCKM